MYESFFGFTAKPFSTLADPRFLVETETHREALAALQYGIQERKGFIVLTGEVGTGKTLMIRALLERLGPEVATAYVTNPRMDLVGFFTCMFAEFGIPNRPTTKGDCLVALNSWLIDQLVEGRTPVLIVDEGQSLSREMLEELRLLTNLETAEHKLLHLVLAGQPELDQLLADPSLRQFVQRITVRHRLLPLTKEETRQYVSLRLAKVGADARQIFTDRALKWVYRYAKGIPRITNALCDAALMIAYSAGQREVTHRTVKEAARMVAAVAA
ncbi:MAG TPA: AAA family ATPase [Sandaracinaceae bacterium]